MLVVHRSMPRIVGEFRTEDRERTIRVLHPESGREIWSRATRGTRAKGLAFHENGDVYASFADGHVRSFARHDGRELASCVVPKAEAAHRIDAHGDFVACLHRGRDAHAFLRVRDRRTLVARHLLDLGPSTKGRDVHIGVVDDPEHGDLIVCAASELIFVAPRSGRVVGRRPLPSAVTGLAIAPTRRDFATTLRSRSVEAFAVVGSSWSQRTVLTAERDAFLYAPAYSASGRRIAVVDASSASIRLLHADGQHELLALHDHRGWIGQIAFDAGHDKLFAWITTGMHARSFRRWNGSSR